MIELINHKENVIVADSVIPNFEVDELFFHGMRTLALGEQKGIKHYNTLPIEHTAMFPVSFKVDGSDFKFEERSRIWLAEPLHDAIFNNKPVDGDFKIEKIKTVQNALILNCLDACYGHALDKLFNAQRHLKQHTDHGLIVIIHPSMKSLVPNGAAEVWEVGLAFQDFNSIIKGFDEFVKTQIKRFEKVYLSKAEMYLDYSKIDISMFAKCHPFPEENLSKTPIEITFILREDRFWLTHSLNQLLYLAVVKFKLLKYSKCYFSYLQNKKIKQLVQKLKSAKQEFHFNVVGLGKTGSLGKLIEDLRESKTDYMKHESQRDQIFSSSHLVIGVHGSHLLIPTALSGSFISLLPEYKIDGYSEDFMPRYDSLQKQALMGRFLTAKSGVSILFKHMNTMIKNYHLKNE